MGSEPDSDEIKHFNIGVALDKEGEIHDYLIITMVPQATQTAFNQWHTDEVKSDNMKWLGALPALYIKLTLFVRPEPPTPKRILIQINVLLLNKEVFMRILMTAIIILVLTIIVGEATAEDQRISTGRFQSIRFKGSNVDIPVLFEDQSLPQNARKEILEDYRLLLSHLQIAGKRTIGKERKLDVYEKKLRLSHAFIFQGGRKKLPDGYEEEYGLIGVGESGVEYLLVPSRLSDAYRLSLALQKREPNMFLKLYKFVQFMNHLEDMDIPPVKELFYFYGEAKQYQAELADKTGKNFKNEFNVYTYKRPSLLIISKGIGELEDMFTTDISIIDKRTGKGIGELPIVYQAEQWKIVMIIPGT